ITSFIPLRRWSGSVRMQSGYSQSLDAWCARECSGAADRCFTTAPAAHSEASHVGFILSRDGKWSDPVEKDCLVMIRLGGSPKAGARALCRLHGPANTLSLPRQGPMMRCHSI